MSRAKAAASLDVEGGFGPHGIPGLLQSVRLFYAISPDGFVLIYLFSQGVGELCMWPECKPVKVSYVISIFLRPELL